MKIVSDMRDIERGDILLTKNMAAKLVAQPGGGCKGCVFESNDEDGCSLIRNCPQFSIFKKVVPTEEIEHARSLFILKGELL